MTPVEITTALTFVEALRALSVGRQDAAIGRLYQFQRHPHDPALKLRPLRCAPGHWIINSRHGDRIILREAGENRFVAVDVGGHEMYDVWERRAGPE